MKWKDNKCNFYVLTRGPRVSNMEKVFSSSLNYQRILVSVPDPENRVSYIPELSKPSIFSPSLV
jgi:hypothetical protein